MDNEILKIIVDGLCNERLDEIVMQSKEYMEVQNKIEVLYLQLKNLELPRKTMETIDDYFSEISAAESIYNRIAYEQGMKDFASFMCSLLI